VCFSGGGEFVYKVWTVCLVDSLQGLSSLRGKKTESANAFCLRPLLDTVLFAALAFPVRLILF
jgi:hypothetical protein